MLELIFVKNNSLLFKSIKQVYLISKFIFPSVIFRECQSGRPEKVRKIRNNSFLKTRTNLIKRYIKAKCSSDKKFR